jgi:hypothetical protein
MRALILAYDFPPFVSVGGLRPFSWLRYFRSLGLEPTVVTRQWEHRFGGALDYVAPSRSREVVVEETPYGRVVRSPYFPNLSNRLLLGFGADRLRIVRKALSAWSEVAQYHYDIGPKRQLYFAALRQLESHRADVIVATGDPFVLFRYAARLSARFRIPWVADYRDPWTNERRSGGRRLLMGWEKRLERSITSSASAISTVAQAFVLPEMQGHPGRPLHIVPNGFDPEAMARGAVVVQRGDRLTIGYAGSVCRWHPLESVLRSLAEYAIDGRTDFEMRFIGVNVQPLIESLIASRYPCLQKHVAFVPRLPNAAVAEALASANLFLVFNNYSYPGTKIYDYLALKRRILLCYTDEPEAQRLKAQYFNLDDDDGQQRPQVLEEILADTGAGVAIRDSHHLKEVLDHLFAEFASQGSIRCDSRGVERFSRQHAAELMAAALKDCVVGEGGRFARAHSPRHEDAAQDRQGRPSHHR